MLRITTENSLRPKEIKLEGKLAGVWVDEVERTWQAIAGDRSRKPVLVDLCGVTFIDAEGKKLLIRMSGEGALFRCCGPDVTATVEAAKREASSDPSSRPQL